MKQKRFSFDEKSIARFWAKVDKSGDCWEWTAAKSEKGYGKFSVGGGRVFGEDGKQKNSMGGAHRFSFELANGLIPDGPGAHGFCVLHRCDNPGCVNPNHLFLGTNEDNVHDMDTKGRRVNAQPKGDEHPASVLTEAKVREIVARYSQGGITQKQLSIDFGVCLATVNHIFTGRLWGHLGLKVDVESLKRTMPKRTIGKEGRANMSVSSAKAWAKRKAAGEGRA